jgi:outer membrane protein OmpA-like peptidoglycan-associated protein
VRKNFTAISARALHPRIHDKCKLLIVKGLYCHQGRKEVAIGLHITTVDERAAVAALGPFDEEFPMKVTSGLLVLLAGTALVFNVGCATKNYVRQQSQPIIDKSNELDALTAKNSNAIKDVDARAQSGIQAANQKAAAADQKATDARNVADQAQTAATQASGRADTLTNQLANLDNYHDVVETSVHFGFDKASLTSKAKSALDQLLAEIPNTKGYIVVVEGDTDSVGNARYNYELSQRRADAVVEYLSEKSVPPHKIYVIGLGKDKAAESNRTAAGRAKNRRVEVRLMSNNQETASAQGTATAARQ